MRKAGTLHLVMFTVACLLGSIPPRALAQGVYTGSVANSQYPNSPASLRITLNSDDGRRVAGLLQIGPPLGGSGPFTGYRSGDSLFIITASANGDTIVWVSSSGGAEIGGGYWVTGGRSRGQKGVWSAQVASRVVSPPNRVFSPPQENQIAVEIQQQTDDMVGERLVYFVRETFRKSTAFRVTDLPESRVQVIISTMPRFPDDPSSSTIYSVVWNLVIPNGSSDWTTLYLSSTLGYAGRDVVTSSAETIVARTDNLMTDVRHLISNQ
jgi:hypothetical protein